MKNIIKKDEAFPNRTDSIIFNGTSIIKLYFPNTSYFSFDEFTSQTLADLIVNDNITIKEKDKVLKIEQKLKRHLVF